MAIILGSLPPAKTFRILGKTSRQPFAPSLTNVSKNRIIIDIS